MNVSQKFEQFIDSNFGIYVHWPFCESKCPYCDFNSFANYGSIDQADILAGYIQEILHLRSLTGPKSVSCIFIGGGTASLMLPPVLDSLLRAIQQSWHVESWAEITLEANPSNVELGRFKAYRSVGINRLSLGVQALRDFDLQALGRLHTARQALVCIDITAKIFPNFSLDLIYARPNQTLDDWRCELSQVLSLGGQHLSLNQLIIQEGTLFANKRLAGELHILEPELANDMYALTQQMTTNAGLKGYEISNHAVPGLESQHNLLYWRCGEYAGIGPGAHGRIISNGYRIAILNEYLPEKWLAKINESGNALIEFAKLSKEEQAVELIIMGL